VLEKRFENKNGTVCMIYGMKRKGGGSPSFFLRWISLLVYPRIGKGLAGDDFREIFKRMRNDDDVG
jgi:hypothetical protein